MSNRTVVIYNSKTGFAERYARWLSEELECRAVSYQERRRISLADYDTVIYGGGVYAGQIRGIKWFRRQAEALQGKRAAVFATGASPDGPEAQKALHQCLDGALQKTAIFYLPGGLCYERMGAVDRCLMVAFRAMLRRSEPDSEALRMMQSSYDLTDRSLIGPIAAYCKGRNP